MKVDTLKEVISAVASEIEHEDHELRIEPMRRSFRLVSERDENVIAIIRDRPAHVRVQLDKFKQGELEFVDMMMKLKEE